MRKAVLVRPSSTTARPLTVRVRLAVAAPSGASVTVADVLLQPGSTATGWVPNVTEMPWLAGVVAGG